jgi:hypothetical protein
MKGRSLGFYTETSYMSPEGDAVADVAWALNTGQKPVFTFTVEEKDPTMIFAGALQWAGSSTEPRSWMHIYVFLGGSLEAPADLLFPSNIKVYDSQGITNLPYDLEELTAHMVQLLSRYGSLSTGFTLKESVKIMTYIAEGWPRGKLNTRLSYRASARLGEGLFLFTSENEDDEGAEKPSLKPSRNVVPLEVVSGGVNFGSALMRLIEAEDSYLLFSTEHRNYPFILRLKVAERGGPSMLDLWFDADKSNVPQALEFSALIEAVESSKLVRLLGPSDEVAELIIQG